MKTIILARHAKSDWSNASLNDFDRPLNGRGKRDAPVMAKRLKDKKIGIDAFVSSPAKRARKTAVIFATEYGISKDDIRLVEDLYGAIPAIFYKVISELNNQLAAVAIFSHNPGITDFANLLTHIRIDNMPTSGVFALTADCNNWIDFKEAKKEFLFFDYPKSELG